MIARLATVLGILTCGLLGLTQSIPGGGDLRVVTVRVVDADSTAPITAFDYSLTVEAPDGYRSGDWRTWLAVASDDGTFQLDVPESCMFTLAVRAPGYVYDTSYHRRYEIRAGDEERLVVHTVKRGVTVSGRIVAEGSGKPVANARISPAVFYSPMLAPDRNRSVWSGIDGRFRIEGIERESGSIIVEHEEFLDGGYDLMDSEGRKPKTQDVRIELRAGDTVFGTVLDENGAPVEGARVDSGDGKTTRTGPDGAFQLKGVRRHWNHDEYFLKVENDGYMDWWKTPQQMPDQGFEVVLEPLFEIQGRVIRPDGTPATSFTVSAGPGRNPAGFESVSKSVVDAQGRFVIAIDIGLTSLGGLAADGSRVAPEHWVGVKVDDYAVWETWVPFRRDLAPLIVKLDGGVSVSGTLSGLPDGFVVGEAVLAPVRPPADEYVITENCAQKLGTLRTGISLSGEFRFEHVRPDSYTLTMSAQGITPKSMAVSVSPSDCDLGLIEMQSSGRILGRVFQQDGNPWAFADCVLYRGGAEWRDTRRFKADENGRFVVEDVPAGEVRVGAESQMGCIVYADLVTVRVEAGATIPVIVNDPDRSRDVRVRLIVGDGSAQQAQTGTGRGATRLVSNVTTREPMFRIDLEPRFPGPLVLPDMSDWHTPDANGMITIPDVQTGAYTLRVFDWLMSRGFRDGALYETEIEATSGMPPVDVPLGAGAITGKLIVTGDIKRMPQVIAVEKATGAPVRRARCDDDGNFCVRYLPPGTYELRGHEDANGNCRVGPVQVKDDITDVGEHMLAAGAAIRGTIRLRTGDKKPTAVHAVDEFGVSLEALDCEGRDGETFAISNLWPGKWTVRLLDGRRIVTEEHVKLAESGTVEVTLAGSR